MRIPTRALCICAAAALGVWATSCASSSPPQPAASSSSSKSASRAAASPVEAADGSAIERAVVVPRDTEDEGIAWEYAWIRQHYGEYRREGQKLIVKENGRKFDQVAVELSDGTRKTLYFDVTRYFGRY